MNRGFDAFLLVFASKTSVPLNQYTGNGIQCKIHIMLMYREEPCDAVTTSPGLQSTLSFRQTCNNVYDLFTPGRIDLSTGPTNRHTILKMYFDMLQTPTAS